MSRPIIEPPEGDERSDDELVGGDAFGRGYGMKLLANGDVLRPMNMTDGQVVGWQRHRALDTVEVTQVLVALLRRQARLERRIQQLEQRPPVIPAIAGSEHRP